MKNLLWIALLGGAAYFLFKSKKTKAVQADDSFDWKSNLVMGTPTEEEYDWQSGFSNEETDDSWKEGLA